MSKRTLARLALFAGVGASGIAVNSAAMRLALSLGVWPLFSSLGASLIATMSNFSLNSRITWRGERSRGRKVSGQMARYFAISAVGALLTAAIMETGRGLGLDPFLSQIAGVGIASAATFAAQNRITFGGREPSRYIHRSTPR